MKTLRDLKISPILLGSNGLSAIVGDVVRLYLDTTSVPSFPEYVTGTVVAPITVSECRNVTSYNIEYADIGRTLRVCDVVNTTIVDRFTELEEELDNLSEEFNGHTHSYDDLTDKPVAGVDFAPAYPRAIAYEYGSGPVGVIPLESVQNQKPKYYSSSTRYCYWEVTEEDGDYWELRTGGTKKFRSSESVASPDLVLTWTQVLGAADTISVVSADVVTTEAVKAAAGGTPSLEGHTHPEYAGQVTTEAVAAAGAFMAANAGGAATLNVGTTAGTVAAGNDSRFPVSLSKKSTAQVDSTSSSSLSDITGLTGYALESSSSYEVLFIAGFTSGAGGYQIQMVSDQDLDAGVTNQGTGIFTGATPTNWFKNSSKIQSIIYRTETITSRHVMSTGIITTGSVAPTVKFQFGQNSTNVTASSLLIGACAVFRKIG